MIWKFIASVIVLVLVTAGTASAEWYKTRGGNEFDGKNVSNTVSDTVQNGRWDLRITKWENGTIQAKLVKSITRHSLHAPRAVFECTPFFQVLVDGVRKDALFIVSRVDRHSFHFSYGRAIMELAVKHDKILFRDKTGCTDTLDWQPYDRRGGFGTIIRFNTQGHPDFSW